MTSLLLSKQKGEERDTQYSAKRKSTNSSEISICYHKNQHINANNTLRNAKTSKRGQEAKFKPPGSTNYDVMDDAPLTDDVTNPDVNKPIAGTREVQKHLSLSRIRPIGGSLRVCNMTFTKITLLLAMIISVFGCLFNIRLSERKSTVGNSASLLLSEPLVDSFRDFSFRSIFNSSANILGINEGLCPCMMTEMVWNNDKRLIRRRQVLHNTRIRNKGGYGHTGYSHSYPGCHGYAKAIMQSFTRIFLAGKRLVTYICLFVDFWASITYYYDIYSVNLELDDNFKVFYDLIYLYIYDLYCSWVSCDWATYPEDILIKTNTLVYFLSKVIILMIKSHDKYQSLILKGLTRAEKAIQEIDLFQSIIDRIGEGGDLW